MPSTYTDNGGIELPANGEQASTWGNTVNDNMNIIDRLINGVGRSEERRVGKECRSRWWTEH